MNLTVWTLVSSSIVESFILLESIDKGVCKGHFLAGLVLEVEVVCDWGLPGSVHVRWGVWVDDQLGFPRIFPNSVKLSRIHGDEVVHRVDDAGSCLQVVLC